MDHKLQFWLIIAKIQLKIQTFLGYCKTTKLIMLESHLQLVCINSGLAGHSPNLIFSQISKEHKLHLFFTRFQSEKPNFTLLNQKILLFTS